jgi:hypothetical protein
VSPAAGRWKETDVSPASSWPKRSSSSGRTDDTLQAKTNPFVLAAFTDNDYTEAERAAGQRLQLVRVSVAGRMHRMMSGVSTP